MLLAIDVGNTETKFGVFHGGSLHKTWRVRTQGDRTADEFAVLFAQLFALDAIPMDSITGVMIASVVPSVNRALMGVCRERFRCEPRLFRPAEQHVMRITTERPGEVGADLVAAAIGARARLGSPVIVVMYGTATTIAAVDASGAYAGVAIAPGIQVALDALIGRAAKLPQIALAPPPAAIGRTTITAVQSGVLFGTVAQTEGMVARFRAELGSQAPVIASGGHGELIAAQTTAIDLAVPSLVLEGLAICAATQEATASHDE